MVSRIPGISAAVLALTVTAVLYVPSAAEAGCSEDILKTAAASVPGMSVVGVKAVDSGVVMAVRKPGDKGVVIVGMGMTDQDFVTYQGAYGRPGVSTLSADESAWLGRLFDKVGTDAKFAECGEVRKSVKPSQEAMFAAMASYSKDLLKDNVQAAIPTGLLVISVVAGLSLLLAVAVVVVIVRVRRRKASSGKAEPASVDVGNPAPSETDEQSEVV